MLLNLSDGDSSSLGKREVETGNGSPVYDQNLPFYPLVMLSIKAVM